MCLQRRRDDPRGSLKHGIHGSALCHAECHLSCKNGCRRFGFSAAAVYRDLFDGFGMSNGLPRSRGTASCCDMGTKLCFLSKDMCPIPIMPDASTSGGYP
jgi:hypothetical protein